MADKESLSTGERLAKAAAYTFGGFLAVVGLLVLTLAKSWAGLMFLVMGGTFVWAAYKYVKPGALRARAAGKAQAAAPSERATKVERFTKWQWFDWLFFIGAGVIFALLLAPRADFALRLVMYFGWGVAIGGVYHLTLRRLWATLFPHLYREWACSRCRKVVPGKSDRCPKCGTEFEPGAGPGPGGIHGST